MIAWQMGVRHPRFFLRPPFSKQSTAVWKSGVGPPSLSTNSGCRRGWERRRSGANQYQPPAKTVQSARVLRCFRCLFRRGGRVRSKGASPATGTAFRGDAVSPKVCRPLLPRRRAAASSHSAAKCAVQKRGFGVPVGGRYSAATNLCLAGNGGGPGNFHGVNFQRWADHLSAACSTARCEVGLVIGGCGAMSPARRLCAGLFASIAVRGAVTLSFVRRTFGTRGRTSRLASIR